MKRGKKTVVVLGLFSPGQERTVMLLREKPDGSIVIGWRKRGEFHLHMAQAVASPWRADLSFRSRKATGRGCFLGLSTESNNLSPPRSASRGSGIFPLLTLRFSLPSAGFMHLHSLKPYRGSRKAKKRVARGSAAGGGTTAGRGTKGQQSRTGKGRRLGFEGGQTPLIMRQPKLGGFRNPNRVAYEVINIGELERKLDAGTYDVAALRQSRVVRTKRPVKLLGKGEVKKKFVVTVHAASAGAKEAIEKAGGSVTLAQ